MKFSLRNPSNTAPIVPPVGHILLSISIIILVTAITVIWHWRMVIADEYILLPFFEKWQEGPFPWKETWRISGGHFHFLTQVLQLYLLRHTHWNTLYEVIASLLFLFAGWFYLIRILRRTSVQISSTAFYTAALPLLTFILWSLDQSGNLFWGWQIAVFQVVLAVIAAIFYLTESILSLRHLLAAMLFCTLGIYSYLMTYAFLPIGFVLIVLHPNADVRQKCLYGIVWVSYSCLVSGHYYLANQLDPQKTIVLESALFYVKFLIYFLGSPIIRFAGDLAWLVFAMALAMVSMSLYRSRTSPRYFTYALPYLAFMAFACGAAMITALGRSDLGASQAFVSRYITLSNFFWLGVFALALMGLSHPLKYTRLIMVCLAFLIVMKTINSAQVARKNIENSLYFDRAAQSLLTSYPVMPDDATLARINSNDPPERVKNDLRLLRDYHLNLFYHSP